MANIGSEVFRTLKWQKKNPSYSQLALERALELLDLTLTDRKNRERLKEIARVREALIDYFVFDNEYASTKGFWENYFLYFNYAARVTKDSF